MSSVSDQPNPPHPSGLAQKEFAPLNSAVLLTGSVVGALATLATDIFHSAVPAQLPLVCAAGWAVCVVACIALLGRGEAHAGDKCRFVRWFACLRAGLSSTVHHWRYALLMAAMSGLSVYSVYARLRHDDGGALNALGAAASQTHVDLARTNAVLDGLAKNERQALLLGKQNLTATRALQKTAPTEAETAQHRLASIGYSVTETDGARAVAEGDLAAIHLLQQAGLRRFSVNSGPASALEDLVLQHQSNVRLVLQAVRPTASELDTAFDPMAWHDGRLKIPGLRELLMQRHIEVVDHLPDPLAEGATYALAGPNGQPFISLRIPAAMLALWSGNRDAVQALMAEGARPDAAAEINLMTFRAVPVHPELPAGRFNMLLPSSSNTRIVLDTKSEAERLGKSDWLQS